MSRVEQMATRERKKVYGRETQEVIYPPSRSVKVRGGGGGGSDFVHWPEWGGGGGGDTIRNVQHRKCESDCKSARTYNRYWDPQNYTDL